MSSRLWSSIRSDSASISPRLDVRSGADRSDAQPRSSIGPRSFGASARRSPSGARRRGRGRRGRWRRAPRRGGRRGGERALALAGDDSVEDREHACAPGRVRRSAAPSRRCSRGSGSGRAHAPGRAVAVPVAAADELVAAHGDLGAAGPAQEPLQAAAGEQRRAISVAGCGARSISRRPGTRRRRRRRRPHCGGAASSCRR
jgi:hypothetical protein